MKSLIEKKIKFFIKKKKKIGRDVLIYLALELEENKLEMKKKKNAK